MSHPVELLLGAAGRRLAWSLTLRRVGWMLLVAGALLELAWLASARAGLAATVVVVGLIAGMTALGRARRGPAPGLVAAIVDARADGGGAVAAAAEALAGAHARFAPLVLAEAERVLAGWTPAALVPLRAPPGLLLGAASLVLLPALLAGEPRAAATQSTSTPSLLSPAWVAGGGEAAGDPTSPAGEAPLELTAADAGATQTDGPDPLAALSPELADWVRERLADLAREHGVGGGPSREASAAAAAPPGLREAEQALLAGDPQRALDALDALADAAAGGDQGAAQALRELADRAGAGGGRGDELAPGAAATSSPTPLTLAGGRRARLPRLLEVSLQRYFASLPGRSTP